MTIPVRGPCPRSLLTSPAESAPTAHVPARTGDGRFRIGWEGCRQILELHGARIFETPATAGQTWLRIEIPDRIQRDREESEVPARTEAVAT